MTVRSDRSWKRTRALPVLLGIVTLVVFGGAGVALIELVQHRDLPTLLLGPAGWFIQVPVGVVSGSIIGLLAWWWISRPLMRPVLDRYAGRIGPLISHRSDQVLVSMCAGVGEELFFRGAVQHWLGVPITAILFVALHGYLDPRDWRLSVYGVLLSIAMMGLGWMVGPVGLLAPILAHAVIDLVLLDRLHATWRSMAKTANPEDAF